jgi:hypothetical protein
MALTTIPSGMIAPAQTLSLNGITFPATQSASADANTLDDYEEGTWTCVVSGQSATATGQYTKVGNLVYVTCRFNCNSSPSSDGALNISGFPFTTAADPKGAAPLRLTNATSGAGGNEIPLFSTGVYVFIALEGNATLHYIRSTSTGSNPYYYDNLFKSNTVISFSFTYQAA